MVAARGSLKTFSEVSRWMAAAARRCEKGSVDAESCGNLLREVERAQGLRWVGETRDMEMQWRLAVGAFRYAAYLWSRGEHGEAAAESREGRWRLAELADLVHGRDRSGGGESGRTAAWRERQASRGRGL